MTSSFALWKYKKKSKCGSRKQKEGIDASGIENGLKWRETMEVQASSLRISTKQEAFSKTRERARKDSQYYCQGKMS